jgi:hypothetical protein
MFFNFALSDPPSDEEQSIKSDEDDFEEEPSEEESIGKYFFLQLVTSVTTF